MDIRVDDFIRRYQTADFIIKLITAQSFCLFFMALEVVYMHSNSFN